MADAKSIHRAFTLLISAFLLVGEVSAHGVCGTQLRIDNFQRLGGKLPQRATSLYKNSPCKMEDYYDSVYTRETAHFQIFYTLGNGPHATTEVFVDSLAESLEKAFTFHTVTMGMRTPQGLDTTAHYHKPVKDGLYPVEVAEINFLRDPYEVLLSQFCEECYGITYPSKKDYRKSSIIIDNDFKYVPVKYSTDSIEVNGIMCPYPIASEEITSTAYGYSYADEWAKAIRVSIFHELFHAVQLQYMDVSTHLTFWTEASATANEELGAPDVDDYIFYIPKFINSTGIPLDKITNTYSISAFYLYLYNHIDKHFDREIWELFSKEQNTPFKEHLKTVLDKQNLTTDSIYHDFATKLAISGPKAKTVDKKFLITDDQIIWPSPRPMTMEQYTRLNQKLAIAENSFIPDTTNYAFNFYLNGTPIINDYRGHASAIMFIGDRTSIREITNTQVIDTINTEAFFADSIIWVFSRFDNQKFIPEIITDSTLRAYPMPWRGQGPLCFTPLPENKKFIEIRNGRGELVLREPYTRVTHCIEGDKVKEKMKPGMYRFRTGSSGKTQKFLIIY